MGKEPFSSVGEGLASVRILQLLLPHLGYAMDSAPLQDFGAEGLDAKTLADLELHRGRPFRKHGL